MKNWKLCVVVAAALALGAMPSQARDRADTQWKRGEGAASNLTMKELIDKQYDIRGAQPKAGGAWIYLQKGTSVYRCDDGILDLEVGGLPTCLELVQPFYSR